MTNSTFIPSRAYFHARAGHSSGMAEPPHEGPTKTFAVLNTSLAFGYAGDDADLPVNGSCPYE
ncbi:MAG: hypothetical protein ACRBB0_23200 [Pelagimonas sp.]